MNSVKKNIYSKHAKYTTGNPISHILVRDFFKEIRSILTETSFSSLLDIGCGEGLLLASNKDIVADKRCCAIDIDEQEVRDALKNIPFCEVKLGSIYNIPFPDGSFELVNCTEVLEHLEDPEKALTEIERVSTKYVILSVPREPIWRILNILRFSYLQDFGNTPGHLNHWSSRKFENFVSSRFDILKVFHPLPWTLILAVKK